jgi:AbrB family looped-hinge helix DNA binding protein
MATTLTSKGQVTIPKRIRDALQLLPGTAVEFSVNATGDVVLRPAHRPKLRAQGRRIASTPSVAAPTCRGAPMS